MSAGKLSFTLPEYKVREDGTWITEKVGVTRSEGFVGAVTGRVNNTSSTAAARASRGSDYTVPHGTGSNQVLSWADGESGTKFCDFVIIDDNFVEGDELLPLTLNTFIGGVTAGAIVATKLIIVDDDFFRAKHRWDNTALQFENADGTWGDIVELKGEIGIPGAIGAIGAIGATGVRGDRGDIGIPGVTGIQGIPGIPGIPGATGIQGIQGIPGATGVQGNQGIPGINALSNPLTEFFQNSQSFNIPLLPGWSGQLIGTIAGNILILKGQITATQAFIANNKISNHLFPLIFQNYYFAFNNNGSQAGSYITVLNTPGLYINSNVAIGVTIEFNHLTFSMH